MRVISVLNLKGGVAKTFTAANVAYELYRRGYRVAKMFFGDVASGKKPFELQKNDRDYKQGDILELAEYTNGEETGRIIKAEVTYMLQEYAGLAEGYCVMAIKVMGIVSETDTKGVEA